MSEIVTVYLDDMKLVIFENCVLSAEIEVDGIISRYDIEDNRHGFFSIRRQNIDFDIVGARWPNPKPMHDLDLERNFEY